MVEFEPRGRRPWGAREAKYNRRCVSCHGASVVSGKHAPDLRRSSVVLPGDAFAAVIRDGVMVREGMPRFQELSDKDRDDLREYIRGPHLHAREKLEGRLF